MARENFWRCRNITTCSAGPTPSPNARPCSAGAWSTAPGANPQVSCMSAMTPAISKPARRTRSARARLRPGRDGRYSDAGSEDVSALAGVTPGLVPVFAVGVDDAAVGLEELVGDLEDREHQPALGTPGNVGPAGLAPDVFAGSGFDALRGAFLVDEAALENVGLLDVDVLVVGQHSAGRKPHQRGHQPGRAIEQQRLGLAAGEAGFLPLHALGADEVGMRV